MGPNSLYGGSNITYIMDKCKNKPELNNTFRDFFIEILANKLMFDFEPKTPHLIEYYLPKEKEEALIDYIKYEGFHMFLESELFICSTDWEENVGIELRFKERDILAVNYKKEDVGESIAKILDI